MDMLYFLVQEYWKNCMMHSKIPIWLWNLSQLIIIGSSLLGFSGSDESDGVVQERCVLPIIRIPGVGAIYKW